MRKLCNSWWPVILLNGAILGIPLRLQAQNAWPLAVDVAAGTSHGWGGEYRERTGGAVSLTITNDHAHAATRTFTAGYSRIGGDNDMCLMAPGDPGRCLGDFPSTYHMGLLFGASYRLGAASVRAFGGPAFFVGDAAPGLGPQAQLDVAVGVPHVELVAGYRASAIFRGEGETQGLGSWLIGLRFR